MTEEVYKGKRTGAVMTRLGEVAKEAIEPALLRVMGDDFLDKLKERIQRLRDTGETSGEAAQNVVKPDSAKPFEEVKGSSAEEKQRVAIETTQEELDFFALIRDICAKGGTSPEEILYRDTTSYFNISYRKPTKWFLRFFSNPKRKSIVTWVPAEEAKQLVSGFAIEEAPAAFGVSRVYLENIAQIWALKALVLRSLELSKASKDEVTSEVAAVVIKEAPPV